MEEKINSTDSNYNAFEDERQNNRENNNIDSDIKPEDIEFPSSEQDINSDKEIYEQVQDSYQETDNIPHENDDDFKDNEIDDEEATTQKQMADYTAKWLVDIFCNVLTMVLVQYAKIDKKIITQAILEGYFDEKYLSVIDKQNKDNEKKLQISEQDKRMMLNPIQSYVSDKNVKISPLVQILVSAGIIVSKTFFVAKSIKDVNKTILTTMLHEMENKKEKEYTESTNVDYDDLVEETDDNAQKVA